MVLVAGVSGVLVLGLGVHSELPAARGAGSGSCSNIRNVSVKMRFQNPSEFPALQKSGADDVPQQSIIRTVSFCRNYKT